MLTKFYPHLTNISATKNLIEALSIERTRLNSEYVQKAELKDYFRMKAVRISDRPFKKQMRIQFTKKRKVFEISFKSGKYAIIRENEPDKDSYFAFQVSHDSKDQAILVDCYGLEPRYLVANAFITPFPITVKRFSYWPHKEKEYRGRIRPKINHAVMGLVLDYLKEFEVSNDLIKNCILLARDKEKRLYIDWVDKIHNFLTLS